MLKLGTVALAAVIVGIPVFCIYGTQRIVTAHVTGAQNVCRNTGSSSNGGSTEHCKYLVYTDDHGTYENVDNMWFLKWNSSDYQGKFLHAGTWQLKVVGFRFGPRSWYPNIVGAKKIA